MRRIATQKQRSDRGDSPGARSGFTLLEVLIVIALIGVFTALFVVNYDSMLRQSEADAVETTFWRAVREARTRALLERHPQALRFDQKAAEFVVEEPGETRGLVFAIPRENWAPDTKLEVKLQKRVPPSQFTLVQGELIELREIPAVGFFPDGTCMPFSLTYEVGGKEATLEIDPWTGAQLLKADEG
jgi:general secretion pathway protein H